MTRTRWTCAFITSLLLTSTAAFSQPYAPVVTMSVTGPDGRLHELTAPESGLAHGDVEGRHRIRLSSNHSGQLAVEPDCGNRFQMATADAPTASLGEVDLQRGGPAVESKTRPAFRVAVLKVAPPAGQADSEGQATKH